ncbi:MAG: DnaJ domain-containing protein [Thermodesulfobacteriota bacterium]
MKGALKILLPFLAVLYILSPYDFLPDVLPYLVGRVDDLLVLAWLVFFILRWNRRRMSRRPGTGAGEGTQTGGESGQEIGRKRTARPDPYDVLGLSPGAGPEEIRAAYRRESQKYHPDKVSHLGEEFQELANQKFIEIKQAYDELRARGGW